MGKYSVWSTDLIKVRRLVENAYVVVEGVDEADAYKRGARGMGWPLWVRPPKTPLFDRLFACREEGPKGPRARGEWLSGFFEEQKAGWEHGDDVGIVLRWAAATMRFHGPSNPDNPALNDGIWGWRSKELEDEILASLTEPGEALASLGTLGDDPEFTAVCVRAVAIMHMGEGPKDNNKAGVLELPKAKGHNLRRFLFFGRRAVT
jgi:hypothetical protein